MIYWTTLTCMLALATAATPAAAQSMKRDPLTMEAGGIRLGMPLAQAKSGAEAIGYSCTVSNGNLSFEQRVAQEVDARKGARSTMRDGAAPYEMACSGRAGEFLQVYFAATREGPVVDRFKLTFDGARSDLAAIRTQLTARYGGNPVDGGFWCLTARCYPPVFSEGPVFVVELRPYVYVAAGRGSLARKADEAAVQAAADRVLPKKSGASF